MEGYIKGQKLGEGTFGSVRRVTCRKTSNEYACKKIKRNTYESEEGIPASVLREISILKSILHPNIVHLEKVIWATGETICILFEICDCDLRAYIRDHHPFTTSIHRRMVMHILRAIKWCHERQVFHRDLKPHNMLVKRKSDGTIDLKIADFGLTRSFEIPMRVYTPEVVTLWYKPPELLLGVKVYDCGLDMWSIGCIFGEIVNKYAIFAGDSEIGQLFAIFRKLGTPTEDVWPGVSQMPHFNAGFPCWKRNFQLPSIEAQDAMLLDRLLTYDPKKRISAGDALALIDSY